jgi:hypothetical protein
MPCDQTQPEAAHEQLRQQGGRHAIGETLRTSTPGAFAQKDRVVDIEQEGAVMQQAVDERRREERCKIDINISALVHVSL